MLVARDTEADGPRCHDAIEIARRRRAPLERPRPLHARLHCLAEPGDYDEGVALIREALAIDRRLNRPDHLNRALLNLTHVLLAAGRLEEAAT